ncbi:YihY/virulence factor BrkB family protein [bacterium]|nr:YihY/virulence factor BrkB family protein [bacterium]
MSDKKSTKYTDEAIRRAKQLRKDIIRMDPRESNSFIHRTIIRISRFFIILWKEMTTEYMFQRAASLTYTTILSLFPLLVMITSLASVFYTPEQEEQLVSFIEQRLLPPTDAGILTTAEIKVQDEREEEISTIVTDIRQMSETYRKSAGRVGVMGFVGVLIAAILMYKSIESAFEAAWELDIRPTFGRTITGFTTLIVLVPLFVGISVTVSSFVVGYLSDTKPEDAAVEMTEIRGLKHRPTEKELQATVPNDVPTTTVAATQSGSNGGDGEPSSRVASMLLSLFPPLLNSLFLALAYTLVPPTRVRFKYALIGGFTAGILWECAKVAFFFYVWMSATRRELIKSLGAVPIFLIWIYFTWIVFLLGNMLTFVSQNFRQLHEVYFRRRDHSNLDSRLLVGAMLVAADSYSSGEGGVTSADLVERLGVDFREANQFIQYLERKKLLARTKLERYVPSRPPNRIQLGQLLVLGGDPSMLSALQDSSGTLSPVGGTLKALDRHLKSFGADRTLDELLIEFGADDSPQPIIGDDE